LRFNGLDIPLPDESIDVAFSDQVIEHLHPDDASQQVLSIHRVLKSGGLYICITPNRLYGPHDISKFFDTVATGLHLKEYTVTDLARLCRRAGFAKVQAYTTTASISRLRIPLKMVTSAERFLEMLPRRVGRGLACSSGLRWLLRSRVVAVKES
jgi:SAM-dependent methyltransferase